MIEVRDLEVVKQGCVICSVLRLDAPPGSRVVVIGPNGSGKTTLLRVLAGLEPGYSGKLRIGPPSGQVVFVHQSPCMLPGTVLSNVMYGPLARGETRNAARDQALEALDALGIAGLESRRRDQLSGGERRRMALARAFVLAPAVLLLDEPLAELDPDGVAAVAHQLAESHGTTVVLTSPVVPPDGIATHVHVLEPPPGIDIR